MFSFQSHFETVIEELRKNYPEFLRPQDLVNLGLYKSRSDLSWSMKRGKGPPSFKLSSHKVVFPRSSLCEWLKQKAFNTLNEDEKFDIEREDALCNLK